MNATQERRQSAAKSAAKPAAKFDSRLIQKRRAQPRLRRTAWGFVTAVFWGMYVYLWMPVITFLLWVLGIRNAYFELYLREHRVEPFLLIALPSLALCAAVLLIAWAEYNRWRFSGKDRRGAPPSAQLDEIARALGADADIGAALNAGRVVVLNMDSQAIPRGVRNVFAPAQEALVPA